MGNGLFKRTMKIDSNNNSKIKYKLLSWYDKNNYTFPWRNSTNPYHVFLSEVMLQQTQVKTALPYYLNWLKRFPKISDVSKASNDEILKQWEGLGYYSRARNFHKAASIISKKYNNCIPKNFDDFIALPGVGEYIAGAVLSIAYNKSLPAVDANAVRVISRLEMNNIPYPKNIKSISNSILKYISKKRPGDFNQSIMDLGREICKSKNPKCNLCPIVSHCKSYINNCVDKYPIKLKKQQKKHINMALGIIIHNNKILISKRHKSGLLGGLWEFLSEEINKGESANECIIRKYKKGLNIKVEPYVFIKKVDHEYSHFSLSLDAYFCNYISGDPKNLDCEDWMWIKPKNIKLYPFPKVNHKFFDEIETEVKC